MGDKHISAEEINKQAAYTTEAWETLMLAEILYST